MILAGVKVLSYFTPLVFVLSLIDLPQLHAAECVWHLKSEEESQKLFLGGHTESGTWANVHMAQSPTTGGERNGPSSSIKCMSLTCRNTKLSVTQQAAGPSPWTLRSSVSHPLWTCAFKMCSLIHTPHCKCRLCRLSIIFNWLLLYSTLQTKSSF